MAPSAHAHHGDLASSSSSSAGGPPPPPSPRRRRLVPDPIRPSPDPRLSGCGPHRSFRHLHHQRGVAGHFRVRLLEGRGLTRRHWSALSLGPAKHLGLSRAHGEVSSFGTVRLAFWGGGDGDGEEEDGGEERRAERDDKPTRGKSCGEEGPRPPSAASSDLLRSDSSAASGVPSTQSRASREERSGGGGARDAFLPSMPPRAASAAVGNDFDRAGKSPLTPLFDQGCLRSSTPARSPFFPAFAATPSGDNDAEASNDGPSAYGLEKTSDEDLFPDPAPPESAPQSEPPLSHSSGFGPPPPRHYARDEFKTSTVHRDSNPIWGDARDFLDDGGGGAGDGDDDRRSAFRVPLRKDDLYPALRADGARVGLEVRLDEEMTPAESILVGGALSAAAGAAAAASSAVGMGDAARDATGAGMELLGFGKDRTIGRGYVDLAPLLLGAWEECWERRDDGDDDKNKNGSGKADREAGGKAEDATLDECGRIPPSAHKARRRIERMGMMDVWVPLYRPSAFANNNGNDDGRPIETSGKVRLLVSYEPHGMTPKRDDVVALESFARRPHASDDSRSPSDLGPVASPVVPPLAPLLVADVRGPYLLLECPTSRTITSVDRAGNVKSSRVDRAHRVRVRRTAAFVAERRTFADACGDVARWPGDAALSTPIGREIADVAAPIVAGCAELAGPAVLWGRLMMAAGGTGVRAGLAGARAATEAVVAASQEKALERRDGGDAGAYGYGG
ncbi:hypothetical protein ACHAWF_002700 [Thalassiosira exigua]